MVIIAGCTTMIPTQNESSVTTEDEASDTLLEVSEGVGDVESTLDDIDGLLS